MRIICGTDFSDQAVEAMHVAGVLAKRLGDSVELIHVLDVPVPVGPMEGMMGLEQFAAAQRQAVRQALGSAAEAVTAHGVRVETRVMEGQAARALMEAGAAADVRLTVLAGHGRSTAERVALGSVADKMARHSDKPLLVVGQNGKTLKAALESNRTLTVVVGLDFGRASDAALVLLRALRAAVAMDVTFVHAYWPPGEAQRLGLHGPADLYQNDPEISGILRSELERKVGTLPGQGIVTFQVIPNLGRPAERVMETADALVADLVLTGSAGKGILHSALVGSSSLAMLHSYAGNVLCAPQRGEEQRAVPTIPDAKVFLVATDFSALGNRAVASALGLARARGGTVEVLHVMPGQELPVWTPNRTATPRKPDHARVEQQLRALVPEGFSGATVRFHVVDAPDPADAVAQAAERLAADVVLVGRHGKSPAVELLVGSTAQRLLGRTRKPVTLVCD